METLLPRDGRHGNQKAIDALTPPYFPYVLDYLWDWSIELRRGCGTGADASLTWPVFDAWARWMHAEPYPSEIDTLFMLDAVWRDPDLAKRLLSTE